MQNKASLSIEKSFKSIIPKKFIRSFMSTQNRYLKSYIYILSAVTLYRFCVLLNTNVDLYIDEAYYWGWSKHFEFGYYSKPPMIAWVIGLFTHFCGDSELCVKLPSLVFYPITTTIIYITAKELFDEKIAFWSAIVFLTLPAVSMSSLIISTDVVLLFFWSLTLYFFVKSLQTDQDKYWIGAGFSAGFGLLSKYNMIIFIVSVFIFLYFSKDYKKFLKNIKLYLSMILAILVYLPNLIWNYHHDFISFVHTKEISEIDRKLFHLNKMFEFLGSQFGVFGLIFFAVLLFLIFKPYVKNDKYRLLYAFTIPFLTIITFQSFLTRAFANWAAPTYISATILVVAYMVKTDKTKLLKIGIGINIAIALLFYHYHTITDALGIELTSKTDPYKRISGWKELAKQIEPIVKKYPNTKLMFDERKIMAEMIYYLKPHPFDAQIYNPSLKIKNQYSLTSDIRKYRGDNFVYITRRPNIKSVIKNFDSYKFLSNAEVPLYKNYKRAYKIYYMYGFKGY